MWNETRVRERIAEIVGRPKNVTFDEVEWVMNQLQVGGYRVAKRKARHGYLFSVGDGTTVARFMVNSHNPGSKQVKEYSVGAFADAMATLGLYDE